MINFLIELAAYIREIFNVTDESLLIMQERKMRIMVECDGTEISVFLSDPFI